MKDTSGYKLKIGGNPRRRAVIKSDQSDPNNEGRMLAGMAMTQVYCTVKEKSRAGVSAHPAFLCPANNLT
jgi:hypothetical protein